MAFLTGLLCYYDDTIATFNLFGSEVQRRSLDGRMIIWRDFLLAFKEHWLLGYGAGNYTLAIDAFNYGQDSLYNYTSYAPNAVVKTLIEYGVFGFVMKVLFIGIVIQHIFKNKGKDNALSVVGVLIVMICLKEMALSTLFSINFGWMAIALLLAYVSYKTEPLKNSHRTSIKLNVIISTLCVLCTLISVFGNEIKINHKISKYDVCGQYQTIYQNINDATLCVDVGQSLKEYVDDFPNNALFNYGLFKYEIEHGDKGKAIDYISKTALLMPRVLTMPYVKEKLDNDDLMRNRLMCKIQSEIFKETDDPLKCSHYAMLAYLLGDKNRALMLANKTVNVLPNLPMPWLLIGEIMSDRGHVNIAKSCLQKYWWLKTGVIQDNHILCDIPTMSEQDLWMKYILKNEEWYGYRNYEGYYNEE